MIFITALAFIIIFSVLILVHEWGHFFAARRSGIKVEEFGIGLPPLAKALFKDKKGTSYTLNWIPFGGFVRLYGEDSSDPKILKAKNSFASKSIAVRALVIVAGVLMNFILAWLLITIGMSVGMKPFLITEADIDKAISDGLIEKHNVLVVHEIIPDSPLSNTDMKAGDIVTRINGESVPSTFELPDEIQPGEMVQLEVLSDGATQNIFVAPTDDGRLGFTVSNAPYIVYIQNLKYPVHIAALESVKEVGRLSYLTLDMLGNVVTSLFVKFAVPDGVAGPVGIAKLTHHFTQQGIIALMQFAALLSISLGVINIMPFPALDGGRLLFIVFELILRKRPSPKWESVIHAVGFGLLMLLIIIITWNDVVNLF